MRLTQNCIRRERAGSCTAERLGIDNTPSERAVERLPLQEELGVDVAGFDQRLAGRDRGWFLYGPDNPLQYDIAGTLGNGAWGHIVGTYDKDAGAGNQRPYLNGARVAQMSDAAAISLNSAPLGIGRHVSRLADPFNGHIDEFRISQIQRSDGWIETTWNNMSDPGAFAVAAAEEQEGGEPPSLAGAGVIVCLMG